MKQRWGRGAGLGWLLCGWGQFLREGRRRSTVAVAVTEGRRPWLPPPCELDSRALSFFLDLLLCFGLLSLVYLLLLVWAEFTVCRASRLEHGTVGGLYSMQRISRVFARRAGWLACSLCVHAGNSFIAYKNLKLPACFSCASWALVSAFWLALLACLLVRLSDAGCRSSMPVHASPHASHLLDTGLRFSA